MKVGKFVIAIEMWEATEDGIHRSYAKTRVGGHLLIGIGANRLAAVINLALDIEAAKGFHAQA